MTIELITFVKESLAKGLKRSEIKTALTKAGWQEDEIRESLNRFAETDFPVPVPKRKPYLSAREAFMYLVMFLTLYISAFSIGTLLFQYINLWMPDAAQAYEYAYAASTSLIRSATASLIITFPIFLWMGRVLGMATRRNPENRSSHTRKWLTYLTLFVTAGFIITDLITLVTYMLGGELTLRFVLKVLVVLAIAGCIFGYYLWDLRQEEKEA